MVIAIRSNSQISYPILSAGAFRATLAGQTGFTDGAPKPGLLSRSAGAIST